MAVYTLWPSTSGPADALSDAEINLGTAFAVSAPAWLMGYTYWNPMGPTHIGEPITAELYTVTGESTGTPVANTTAAFPTAVVPGHQQATLNTPVALTPNQLYRVVGHFPGNYAATGGYWATGSGVGGITQGPLVAPDAGGNPLGIGSTQQGAYKYSSSLSYPNSYFNGANYWVGPVITDTDPANTYPAGGPIGVRASAPVAGLLLGLTTTDRPRAVRVLLPTPQLAVGAVNISRANPIRVASPSGTLIRQSVAAVLRPNTELVVCAWLGQVSGILPGMVATQLPEDNTSWAGSGFVTILSVGGSPGLDTPIRSPIVSVDTWACNPSSNKPPWGKANNLAERIVQATYGVAEHRLVVLPGQFPRAAVHAVQVVTEPRRVYADVGGYARYTMNLQVWWTALT